MFVLNIDISAIESMGEQFESAVKAAIGDASRDLAAMTHAKAVELASERLHSRREMFINGLHMSTDQAGVSIISLDASVAWIDDGMPKHSMIEDLLKSPKAKRAKDGSSYLVVPFHHGPGKGPTNTPESQQDIVGAVKKEMKARKIPWGKLERDDQGRPKLGLLHRFNVDNHPTKTKQGAGQGWGPIGAVKQGPNDRQKVGGGPGGGGTPFLHGVAVYQKQTDKGVKKSVMTFRVVSSKHSSPRWDHPGLEGTMIFADTAKWCEEEADKLIPKIMADLMSKI
jgi:hypothetical protein